MFPNRRKGPAPGRPRPRKLGQVPPAPSVARVARGPIGRFHHVKGDCRRITDQRFPEGPQGRKLPPDSVALFRSFRPFRHSDQLNRERLGRERPFGLDASDSRVTVKRGRPVAVSRPVAIDQAKGPQSLTCINGQSHGLAVPSFPSLCGPQFPGGHGHVRTGQPDHCEGLAQFGPDFGRAFQLGPLGHPFPDQAIMGHASGRDSRPAFRLGGLGGRENFPGLRLILRHVESGVHAAGTFESGKSFGGFGKRGPGRLFCEVQFRLKLGGLNRGFPFGAIRFPGFQGLGGRLGGLLGRQAQGFKDHRGRVLAEV